MLTYLLAIGSLPLPLPLPLPFPFPYFYTPITLPYPPFFVPTSCLHKRPPWSSPALLFLIDSQIRNRYYNCARTRPVPPAVAPPAPPNTILEQQFRPRLLPATYSRLLEKHLQPMSQSHIHAHAPNHTHHHYYAPASSRPKMEGKAGYFDRGHRLLVRTRILALALSISISCSRF
jgi:hypothetical protein